MMKTVTAFALLACLFAIEVEGRIMDPKGRCFCADKGVSKVLPKMIEKIEFIPPGPACKNHEIIVTLKTAEQKCLNLASKFGKKIIKTIEKSRHQREQSAI